jgi:hypothetical protein
MILLNKTENMATVWLEPRSGSTAVARTLNITLEPNSTVIQQLVIGYIYAMIVTINGVKSVTTEVSNLTNEVIIDFIPAKVMIKNDDFAEQGGINEETQA